MLDDFCMGHAARLWLWLIILGSVPACQRKTTGDSGRHEGPAAGSGQPLDRMQFSSARRVALASAGEAMRQGDLERLKQLRVWVQNRAQVAIFEPDDLESLELAIACLEHSSTEVAALDRLARVKSGTLRQAAREACSSKPP